MVLFGAIIGRSTGTRLLADSYCSRNTCVTTCSPPRALPVPTLVGEPCSLASASGTTLVKPLPSTMA